MFKEIGRRIAWQFTAFVFLLLLTNGIIFLAADFGAARRDQFMRLERLESMVSERIGNSPPGEPLWLPAPLRERVRIIDAGGHILYGGTLFSGMPLGRMAGVQEVTVQNEQYAVFTAPVQEEGFSGYLQVADLNRLELRGLPFRAFLYLLVSIAISALIYGVGSFFARRSLKPAEQMVERLEQFTQDASHELRTPLAALSSSLDLALKTKKYQEGIVSAKEDLHEVTALVERLLDLARLDTFILHEEETDLSGLVEETVERLRVMASEKGIALKADVIEDVRLRADALLLRQALGNLISNAVKFNRPDGTVTVRLTPQSLSVIDTGKGISAQALPHVFDRFYQEDTSRAHGGFGLGLALVKRIVDLHEWTIDVMSEEKKGTTFTIHFSSSEKKV